MTMEQHLSSGIVKKTLLVFFGVIVLLVIAVNLSASMWVTNYATPYGVTKVFPNGSTITYNGTGAQPYGIAFDGVNMWVVEFSGTMVTKVQPNGTMTNYTIAGVTPMQIAYDNHGSMWAIDFIGNTIDKINVSTGTSVNFALNGTSQPTSLAFDGVDMWVAYNSGNVTRINISTGIGFNYRGTGTTIYAMAYDNQGSMWLSSVSSPGNLTKVNISNGVMVNFTAPNNQPYSMAYDYNGSLWIGNYGDNSVTKFNISSGTSINYKGTGVQPYAIAYDGVNMWTGDTNGGSAGNNNVTQVFPNGTMVNYTSSSMSPRGIAYDGALLSQAPCIPPINYTWMVTYPQTCNKVNVTTGNNSIVVTSSGTLTLINGANVSTKALNMTGTGDKVFILSKSMLIL